MTKKIAIKNFKSIKDLELDCKRVNVFIGAPNVGKSNIIEALSLFNVPYTEKNDKPFDSLIRFVTLKNLFYDNIPNQTIEVTTDLGAAFLKYNYNESLFTFSISSEPSIKEINNLNDIRDEFSIKGKRASIVEKFSSKSMGLFINEYGTKGEAMSDVIFPGFFSAIRKYDFDKESRLNHGFSNYLLPPDGRNLITIIQNHSRFFSEISSFFDEYGLEILYDVEDNLFEIQKKVNKVVYKYPFTLIADTLQRIIFYLAAVELNQNAVLLFEEPETHSFPPYTKLLAQRISDATDNQFFITTHSPYLLQNIIENTAIDDLNVCVTGFENYQTRVKPLHKTEIGEILDNNIDVFYNLENFLGNA